MNWLIYIFGTAGILQALLEGAHLRQLLAQIEHYHCKKHQHNGKKHDYDDRKPLVVGDLSQMVAFHHIQEFRGSHHTGRGARVDSVRHGHREIVVRPARVAFLEQSASEFLERCHLAVAAPEVAHGRLCQAEEVHVMIAARVGHLGQHMTGDGIFRIIYRHTFHKRFECLVCLGILAYHEIIFTQVASVGRKFPRNESDKILLRQYGLIAPVIVFFRHPLVVGGDIGEHLTPEGVIFGQSFAVQHRGINLLTVDQRVVHHPGTRHSHRAVQMKTVKERFVPLILSLDKTGIEVSQR